MRLFDPHLPTPPQDAYQVALNRALGRLFRDSAKEHDILADSALESNDYLWWDDVNNCLVVGTATTPAGLHANTDIYAQTQIQIDSTLLYKQFGDFNFKATGEVSGAGEGLTFTTAGSTSTGGNLNFLAGGATGAAGTGGTFYAAAGKGVTGGSLNFVGGYSPFTGGSGGIASISGGNSQGSSSTGGGASLNGGNASGTGTSGGAVTLQAGYSDDATNGIGGDVYLVAGAGGTAGNIILVDGLGGIPLWVDSAGGIGFFSATPVTKPTVTGSRGGNAALASLLTALANLGLVTNSTTA